MNAKSEQQNDGEMERKFHNKPPLVLRLEERWILLNASRGAVLTGEQRAFAHRSTLPEKGVCCFVRLGCDSANIIPFAKCTGRLILPGKYPFFPFESMYAEGQPVQNRVPERTDWFPKCKMLSSVISNSVHE